MKAQGEQGDDAADDWLPDLILLSDCGGNWEQYLEAVYEAFALDFMASVPVIAGKRFALKRHPMLKGKEATFWHITSEGKEEEERLPNLRRCERVRWPRALVGAMGTERVRVWQNRRGNDTRILIALPDFSYLVVLTDRGEYIMLWTAYCVEYRSGQEKLRRECEAWEKSNGRNG